MDCMFRSGWMQIMFLTEVMYHLISPVFQLITFHILTDVKNYNAKTTMERLIKKIISDSLFGLDVVLD